MRDSRNAPLTSKNRFRGKRWILFETLVCYGLILVTIWTPRPWQRWFYWGAIIWVVISTTISFSGWKKMGFGAAGFRCSLWVVGLAAVLAAVAVALADNLHTLRAPNGLFGWFGAFAGYAIWAFVQQFLLQGYFLLRLLCLLPEPKQAAIVAAGIFATAHLPNPILTPLTLLWGLCACFIFLRCRNLYPLAAAHAILGVCIAVTVPPATIHHMRVGLGYLTYQHHHHLSQSPQTVSTVACVTADAPTRRSSRHDLP